MRQVYNTISWQEVRVLIRGLLPDTPLGQVVSIRAENNPKTIKSFSAEQRKIRSQWRARLAAEKQADEESLDKSFANLELMLKKAFG